VERRLLRLALFGTLCATLGSGTASTSAFAARPTGLNSAKAAVPAKRLTLKECILIGLKNNQEIYSAKVEEELAEIDVVEAYASFFPNLDTSAGFSNSISPNTSDPNDPSMGRSIDYNVGLSGAFPWGGGWGFGVGSSITLGDDENDTEHGNTLSLSVNQPLLQGMGWTVGRRSLILARMSQKQGKETTRSQVSGLIQSLVEAYWDLWSAQRTLEISKEGLEMGKRQLEATKIKVQLGRMSRQELFINESDIVSRRKSVISAEQSVMAARASLLEQLYLRGAKRLGKLNLREDIIPVDQPTGGQHEKRTLKELWEIAQKWHPSLRRARRSLKMSAVNLIGAENSELPQLDLGLSLNNSGTGYDGRGGGEDDDIAPAFRGGHGTAMGQAFSFRYPTFSVTLSLALPLHPGVRTAGAQRERIAMRQQKRSFTNSMSQAQLAVSKAYLSVINQEKILAAEHKVVEAAKRTLDAERAKFKAGITASFEVIAVQRDYTSALVELAQQKVVVMQARVELELRIGRLDKDFGIEIE
jgi:outer membrane protein